MMFSALEAFGLFYVTALYGLAISHEVSDILLHAQEYWLPVLNGMLG